MACNTWTSICQIVNTQGIARLTYTLSLHCTFNATRTASITNHAFTFFCDCHVVLAGEAKVVDHTAAATCNIAHYATSISITCKSLSTCLTCVWICANSTSLYLASNASKRLWACTDCSWRTWERGGKISLAYTCIVNQPKVSLTFNTGIIGLRHATLAVEYLAFDGNTEVSTELIIEDTAGTQKGIIGLSAVSTGRVTCSKLSLSYP